MSRTAEVDHDRPADAPPFHNGDFIGIHPAPAGMGSIHLDNRWPHIPGHSRCDRHSRPGGRRDSREIGHDTAQLSISEPGQWRSEEHTSELQSLMRISYAVFCLEIKKQKIKNHK